MIAQNDIKLHVLEISVRGEPFCPLMVPPREMGRWCSTVMEADPDFLLAAFYQEGNSEGQVWHPGAPIDGFYSKKSRSITTLGRSGKCWPFNEDVAKAFHRFGIANLKDDAKQRDFGRGKVKVLTTYTLQQWEVFFQSIKEAFSFNMFELEVHRIDLSNKPFCYYPNGKTQKPLLGIVGEAAVVPEAAIQAAAAEAAKQKAEPKRVGVGVARISIYEDGTDLINLHEYNWWKSGVDWDYVHITVNREIQQIIITQADETKYTAKRRQDGTFSGGLKYPLKYHGVKSGKYALEYQREAGAFVVYLTKKIGG